jgi:hypothetical protein
VTHTCVQGRVKVFMRDRMFGLSSSAKFPGPEKEDQGVTVARRAARGVENTDSNTITSSGPRGGTGHTVPTPEGVAVMKRTSRHRVLTDKSRALSSKGCRCESNPRPSGTIRYERFESIRYRTFGVVLISHLLIVATHLLVRTTDHTSAIPAQLS